MKLPGLLYGNNKTRMETVAFGGLNTSENHREGEGIGEHLGCIMSQNAQMNNEKAPEA